MDLTTMREKIHSLIDTTEAEDKLMEIYELLEGKDEFIDDNDYSDEFKAELDAEYEDYQKNKNGIPWEDVNKHIEQLLRKP